MWRRYSSGGPAGDGYDSLAWRVARRGALVNLIMPLGLVVVVYLARAAGLGLEVSSRPAFYGVLLYVFVALGLAELAAAFVIRRLLLTPARFASLAPDRGAVEEAVMRSVTVVFAVGASPILYGVVLYLLGGAMRDLAYFALINLLAFRVLRPGAEFLRRTLGSTPAR